MNETKHTPIPWTCDYDDQDHTGIGIADDEMMIALVAPKGGPDELDKANAEFIVKAVNCHDELVAACENTAASLAICQMPRLDNSVADNDQIIAIALDGLRAALAKVKDGK